MINFIKNIIKKIIKEDKKVLGRWNIDYCDIKINNKIDLSNVDHCGPCGQYILDKAKTEKINFDKTKMRCSTESIMDGEKYYSKCNAEFLNSKKL